MTFQVKKSDTHGFMEIIQALIPGRSRPEFWLCHLQTNPVTLGEPVHLLTLSVRLYEMEVLHARRLTRMLGKKSQQLDQQRASGFSSSSL